MAKTKIDWCDETINIFTGCTNTCDYCYARRMANRLGKTHSKAALPYLRTRKETGNSFYPAFHMDVLKRVEAKLLRSRKTKRIFVGSMGDMCFEGEALVWDEAGNLKRNISSVEVQKYVAQFAGAMSKAGHTVLLLTKRPDLLSLDVEWSSNVYLGVSITSNADKWRYERLYGFSLENIWSPWVSIEPLLDPYLDCTYMAAAEWVVIGVQTGPGSVANVEVTPDGGWTREAASRIIDWCSACDIPVFVKDNLSKLAPDRKWPKQFLRKGELNV